MEKYCIKDIVYSLYDERMEKIDDNKEYKKYLDLESEAIEFVRSHIPERKVMEFENLLYEITSTLSYILFLEGMKANRDLISTFTNSIEEINIEL